jgi:DNA-binding IclR family transcriptional regulator
VCVDWAPGRGIGILVLRPGRSLPLHAGGAGRAVLAFGGLDLDAVLAAAPFERLTPATLVTAAQLRADVADSRRQGHVVSDEDVTVGIGAVAVPVLDGSGVLRGCLSLGGLSADVRRRREEFLTALHGAVAAVRPAGGRGVDGPSVG